MRTKFVSFLTPCFWSFSTHVLNYPFYESLIQLCISEIYAVFWRYTVETAVRNKFQSMSLQKRLGKRIKENTMIFSQVGVGSFPKTVECAQPTIPQTSNPIINILEHEWLVFQSVWYLTGKVSHTGWKEEVHSLFVRNVEYCQRDGKI